MVKDGPIHCFYPHRSHQTRRRRTGFGGIQASWGARPVCSLIFWSRTKQKCSAPFQVQQHCIMSCFDLIWLLNNFQVSLVKSTSVSLGSGMPMYLKDEVLVCAGLHVQHVHDSRTSFLSFKLQKKVAAWQAMRAKWKTKCFLFPAGASILIPRYDIYRYYHCHYIVYTIQSWVILHQSHWAVVLAQHHGAVWHRWTYDTYDIVISSMTLDTLELMAWLFCLTSKAQIMSPDPDQPSVHWSFFFFWDLRCWMTLMLL